MKIIDKREQNTRSFSDVPVGRTFTFYEPEEMGYGLFMRIVEIADEDGLPLNAVNLEEGFLTDVEANTSVILCNAEVIIN